MTKRGMSIALLAAALLALAGAGSAQAAGLSAATAKKLAQKLGRKQVRTQSVVAYHIGKAHRRGANTVSFRYDARTKSHTFCVSVLTVRARRHGNVLRVTAKIGKQKCIKIPADALGFEKATRAAQRSARHRRGRTVRSIASVARSEKRCRDQRVPRSRRKAVAAILDIAETGAFVRPNGAVLDQLVNDLSMVGTDKPVLDSAAGAWADWVDAATSLPRIEDPCATIRRWAKRHWAADSSPIDISAYNATAKRARSDVKAIVKGARYLVRVGVFRDAAAAFVPEGLLVPRS